MAISTQAWGGNTLVCLLPPSPALRSVVVGFKGSPMTADNGSNLQLFTYHDTTDKALMELALQVVGMKMTGRIDDARNMARPIIGSNRHGGNSQQLGGNQTSPMMGQGPFQHFARTEARDWTAFLNCRMSSLSLRAGYSPFQLELSLAHRL